MKWNEIKWNLDKRVSEWKAKCVNLKNEKEILYQEMKEEITLTSEDKKWEVMDIQEHHENLRQCFVELRKDREITCQGKEIANLSRSQD